MAGRSDCLVTLEEDEEVTQKWEREKEAKDEEKAARAAAKAAKVARQGQTGRPTTQTLASSGTPSGCTGGQVARKLAHRPHGFRGPRST